MGEGLGEEPNHTTRESLVLYKSLKTFCCPRFFILDLMLQFQFSSEVHVTESKKFFYTHTYIILSY
jgi:hypothetical protein